MDPVSVPTDFMVGVRDRNVGNSSLSVPPLSRPREMFRALLAGVDRLSSYLAMYGEDDGANQKRQDLTVVTLQYPELLRCDRDLFNEIKILTQPGMSYSPDATIERATTVAGRLDDYFISPQPIYDEAESEYFRSLTAVEQYRREYFPIRPLREITVDLAEVRSEPCQEAFVEGGVQLSKRHLKDLVLFDKNQLHENLAWGFEQFHKRLTDANSDGMAFYLPDSTTFDGYCFVSEQGSELRVDRFEVSKAAQGLGLDEAMWDHLFGLAYFKGHFDCLATTALEIDHPRHAFLLSQGAVIKERLPNKITFGDCELSMNRIVQPLERASVSPKLAR